MKIKLNDNNLKGKMVLINYSDKAYLKSQKKNSKTGLKIGGFCKAISYSCDDIDSEFGKKNAKILSMKRGGGYWLWKPYFIKKTLDSLEWNEYLFYSDSGSYFIDSIHHIKEVVEQDIVPFELQYIEKKWTKRDAFLLMGCDSPKYSETKQRMASFSLWKKTQFSVDFVNEWLTLSQDERLITDLGNTLGQENYNGFVEHRHDQSIFSLLTKKYNLQAYRNPSQFGNPVQNLYRMSTYPQLIVHNRQKNISQKIIGKIKRLIAIPSHERN